MGRGPEEEAHGGAAEGQPGCALPADGLHAVPHARAATEGDPDARSHHDHLRSQLRSGYIFTDGRTLPPQGEPQPWWYGYSVGKWEGETLVVETNNLRGDGWLDVRGSPYTEQATITERFRRPTFGKLEIDITIEDPVAYTRPFTVRVNQQISVDEELIEFICNENQQFRKLIKID
jgi:hypothetical protein